MNNPQKYEDKTEIINEEIRKRFNNWKLTFIHWIDFEDVSQLIKIHIFVKWNKWDQSRPFEPLVNRLITRRMINITRDYSKGIFPPCFNCKYNAGKDGDKYLCKKTPSGIQSSECSIYDKWLKFRSAGKSTLFPLETIGYNNNISFNGSFDLGQAEKKLHSIMKKKLNDKHYFIYKMLFIDGLEEEEIAELLRFKTSEKNRKAGYRQIINLKNKYKDIAKEVLQEDWIYDD